MRDCSSCKHSVDKRPELRDMDFNDTPCAKCRPSSINIDRKRIADQYGIHIVRFENIEQPKAGNWKVLKPGEDENRVETFKYWLEAWHRLDGSDQRIISILMRKEGKTQAQIARDLGVSRQAVNKRLKRLKERWPGVFA